MLGHLKGKRATIAFAVSSSLSLLGNSIAGTVLPLVLLATTGDVLAAGTLAVICAVPQLLAGVMGGMQGLVMPVYFTAMERPELLGYFVSAMSFGALMGSIGYASLTHCLKRRTWYMASLIGMASSLALIGTLPAYPLLLIGAACFGLASGPFSAVLNFYMFDRLPNEKLGAAMGAQNSMLLLVAPAAIFIASVLVTSFGVDATVVIMAVAWLAISLYALVAKAMRRI